MYGGQAVIEGVMIRGRRVYSVAARSPEGNIRAATWPISTWPGPRWRRVPLLRGTLVLGETLATGVRALAYSARVAMGEEVGSSPVAAWTVALTLLVSLALAVGLFFVLPLLVVETAVDRHTESSLLSNLAEGGLRLLIFLAYLVGVGFMPSIRRVFAYHAAEHMTVHAHEAREPLETEKVRRFPPAHPRCGTAFLLTVMLVSVLVFALLGKPDLPLRVASRVLLLPVIAGISYEVIRFSAAHSTNFLVQLIAAPNLALQRLTTRPPDDGQIEVALSAMNTVLAADRAADGSSP